MKKLAVFVLMALVAGLLIGCAQAEEPAWETVSDQILSPVEAQTQRYYEITFSVPEDAVAQTMGDDGTAVCYIGAEEDYEILSYRTESDSIETVARELSGFRYDTLSPLCWEQFSMNRYDFVWSAAEDAGQMVHRAAVLEDGNAYYILTYAVREDAASGHQKEMEEVFKSFALQGDPGC